MIKFDKGCVTLFVVRIVFDMDFLHKLLPEFIGKPRLPISLSVGRICWAYVSHTTLANSSVYGVV